VRGPEGAPFQSHFCAIQWGAAKVGPTSFFEGFRIVAALLDYVSREITSTVPGAPRFVL